MKNTLSIALADVNSEPAVAVPRGRTLGIQHNIVLAQFEAYVSGRLAGYMRYSMRGSEMWLLYTQDMDLPGTPSVGDDLIHAVLVDAGRRRVAVHPYCPAVRDYMRSHPLYLDLVPREWRARFRLSPASQDVPAVRMTVPGPRDHLGRAPNGTGSDRLSAPSKSRTRATA